MFLSDFCLMELNSELFSLPRNVSERNAESLLLVLFHGTEFRAFFSSAERFGTEFRQFSVPRNSRNSPEQSNCSVFRGIIFLSEIANPSDCCRLQYNQPVWWECRNAGYSADSSGGSFWPALLQRGNYIQYIDTPIAFLTFSVARNGFLDTFVQLLVAVAVVRYNSLVQ